MSHPIDEYISALESFRLKDRKLAAEKISKALGADKPTEAILSSLDKIFDKDSMLHKSILDIIILESRKKRE